MIQFLGGSEGLYILGIKPYKLPRGKGRDKEAAGLICLSVLLYGNSDLLPEVDMELREVFTIDSAAKEDT